MVGSKHNAKVLQEASNLEYIHDREYDDDLERDRSMHAVFTDRPIFSGVISNVVHKVLV